MTLAKPKINAIVPWFGSARMVAERIGEVIGKCAWCGVPFGGGMPELRFIDARSIVVYDKHAAVINLAQVIASEPLRRLMVEHLMGLPFSSQVLDNAQAYCRDREVQGSPSLFGFGAAAWELGPDEMAKWAAAYFVCCWMGRSGVAGTDGELSAGLAVRYEAGGGDPTRRYRSAVESLEAWGEALAGVQFVEGDGFELIAKTPDRAGSVLYVDGPWADDDQYKHGFTERDHKRQASVLVGYEQLRVVVRINEHPLVRELYQERDGWTIEPLVGRTQTNGAKAELLIVRGGGA